MRRRGGGAERGAAPGPMGLSHAGVGFQKHARPARGVSSTSRRAGTIRNKGVAVIKTGSNDENSSPELTESSRVNSVTFGTGGGM